MSRNQQVLVTLLFALLVAAPRVFAQTPASHTASCTVNKTPPSDADNAYSKGEYKKAEELYSLSLKANPADGHSHEGRIRSALAQSRVTDAATLADEWTKTASQDADAVLAAGEVRYAEGDLVEAYAILLKAAKIDPCKAAVYKELALFEHLAGYHATERKHITLAHQLNPLNNEIKLEWIESLPRTQEIAEDEQYLNESKLIDDKQRKASIQRLNKLQAESEDSCDLVSSGSSATIPLKPISNGDVGVDSWGLEVFFNGKSRILQIDTGASGMTLTFSVAPGLGLTKVDQSKIFGGGDEGSTGVTIMHSNSVRIGSVEFKNCPVEVLHRAGLLGGGTGIGQVVDNTGGLIGLDIFSNYLVTLDYIQHQLRLEPLPRRPEDTTSAAQLDAMGGPKGDDLPLGDRYIAPSMKSWTSIYRDGHMILMPTRIGATGARLFIVDTGAESNLISPSVAKEVTTTTKNNLMTITGVSGKTNQVFEAGKFTMDFAGLRVPIQSMDSIDTTNFSQPVAVAGFIGYPILEQLVMHIDYRDNLVFFEAPGAKKK